MFAALSRPFRPALSRRSVFIQVEKTPNPFSLKFVPSQAVLGEEHQDKSGFHFHRGDTEYLRSPLAKKLFAIDEVTGIFLARDFVTVSKNEDGAWAVSYTHLTLPTKA